jgi:hypothetical protein
MHESQKITSHFTGSATRRMPQISVAFLMGVTLIFAVMMTAGLVYGLRVPAVREELGWMTSTRPGESTHSAHLKFILFTLTSPLVLAGLLSTLTAILKRLFRPHPYET